MARHAKNPAGEGTKVDLDQLYTPDSLARILIRVLAEDHGLNTASLVIEPSVGGGAFARQLRASVPDASLIVVDVDASSRGLAVDGATPVVGDFLALAESLRGALDGGVAVVGNPPFSKAHRSGEPHVKAALGLAFGEGLKPSPGGPGIVAMLLPTDFLCSKGRAEWLRDNPPQVYFLYPRPKFHGPSDKGMGGQQNLAFLVWSGTPPGAPRWINIDEVSP